MEIEINGYQYRIGKLDAMKQLHVSQRVAPILPSLIPIYLKGMESGFSDLAGFAELLVPLAEGISALDDDKAEYIIGTCLGVVTRLNGQSWSPVWSRQYNAASFEDIDLAVMLKLTTSVIKDSLGPFIRGLVTSQQANPTA